MQFTLRGFSLRRSTGGCSGFLGDDFIEITDDIEGNLVRPRLSWDFLWVLRRQSLSQFCGMVGVLCHICHSREGSRDNHTVLTQVGVNLLCG